jgi:predicted aldo/keto reductase-like oxidoreductase
LLIKKLGRREFLKQAAAGLGGFVYLSSQDIKSKQNFKGDIPTPKKFIYRTLGKTGIKLPVISMGVMNTSNPSLVRTALESGIILLDTAQTYQRGQNEGMIGEILKGRPRDSFVIATKARLPNDQKTGLYIEEATEEAYSKKIDQSLKNLGLDYVDIYYHHNVWKRESALYEPMMKALGKAKKAGKARFVGITTHRNEPEVIQAAIDSQFYDVILTSYNFKQKHHPEIKEAIAKAARAGLGIVAMKVLGGRYLQEGAQTPVDPIAALKWAIQDPNVHTIVPGYTTFDQLHLDLSVMENPTLTPSEKTHLQEGFLMTGLYCQGCGRCLNQCHQSLPIPDLMRAYMYVYGYRNSSLAQELIISLNLPDRVCADCPTCPVNCWNGFKISERLRKVIPLRDVPAEFIA